MGSPCLGVGGGVTMHGCRGWGRAATGDGKCYITATQLSVGGRGKVLTIQKCFSYRVAIYGEGGGSVNNRQYIYDVVEAHATAADFL